MADTKTDQEPSIEEILESIRQIISEDGTPVEAAPAAKPAAPKPVPPPAPKAPEPKALEPKAPEPAPVQKAAPPPKPFAPAAEEPVQERILDLTDRIISEPAHEPAPAPIPRIALEDAMKQDALKHEEHLVSDMTADAAVAAMMKLLSNNIALERELPGKPGPVTLEDMARELMRPLVKQWLDQNLQKIIEKMVAREIERLSARALENQ